MNSWGSGEGLFFTNKKQHTKRSYQIQNKYLKTSPTKCNKHY